MINEKVFYSWDGGDEQFTPKETVECLLPYIQHHKNKVIWCPFDKEESQFVKVLNKNGFTVLYSHIDYKQDFLNYEPDNWDIIISNPPYKNKRVFWERCLSFNKPFCLLMPVNTLSDSLINSTMKDKDKEFQLLIPSRRTCFFNKDYILRKSPSFKAIYYGVNIFNQQIILANMKKQNLDLVFGGEE